MSKEKEEQKEQKDLEIQGEIAHKLNQQILQLTQDTAKNFLLLGQLFFTIQKNKYYETLSYSTWEEYCGSLSWDRSTVFSLIKIYRIFVLERKIDIEKLSQIHYSKLLQISPVLNDKNQDELLEQASTLSRSDLRKEVEVLKTKPGHLLTKLELDGKENVIDEIKKNCPISRGSICPFIKKYPHEVVRQYLDRKK
jgi:hypothetical protein